jgi:hypothetical protein
MRKMAILVVFGLTLCLIAGVTCAGQTAGSSQPCPADFAKFGLAGIAGDQQNLYVMAGGKIHQYNLTGTSLLQSVDLPDLPPPPGDAPPPAASSDTPPPHHHHPPMTHGLWAGNGYLYVLAGPVVYIYSAPGLALKNTVQLPKPTLPQAGN